MEPTTCDIRNPAEHGCNRAENRALRIPGPSALHTMFDASMRGMGAFEMPAHTPCNAPSAPCMRCSGTTFRIDPHRGRGHYWYQALDETTVISSMDLSMHADTSFCVDTVDFLCFGLFEQQMPAYVPTSKTRQREALIGYAWRGRPYLQHINGADRFASTTITFAPEALSRYAAQLSCRARDIAKAIGELDGTREICGLPALFRELAAARPSAQRAGAYYQAKVCEALVLLLDATASSEQCSRCASASSTGIVTSACALIEGNLAADLSTRAISAALHIGMSTLIQAFHDVKHTTPQAYVRTARLERAKLILASGCTSIAEVAAQVGYRNQGAFSEAFRRYAQVTPSRFRRSAPPHP